MEPAAEPRCGVIDGDGFTPLDALFDRAARAASLFAAQQIGAGDSVALLLRNRAAFIEATIAAQHLGAYPVPINWHFTPAEVRYVLQDCSARVLVGDADLIAPLGDLPNGLVAIPIDPDGRNWRDMLTARTPIGTPAAPAVQSMVYTSGTTGRPKGVRRATATLEQAAAIRASRTLIYGTRPGMRALLSAPIYHSAPNFFALNVVRSGGLLIAERRFDAEATLAAIARHRLTHLFMVPTMFVRLLALPDEVRRQYDLSSLESVLHAGAPCAPRIKAAMIDWWGPVLSEYYGSTEMGPLTFCTSTEWRERAGTVGRPLDGIVLEIRDEDGRPCPTGEAGDVCVTQSIQPAFDYHGAPEKSAAVHRHGAMVTGDIGYLDPAGYLFLCDRRIDMIISGGVNIYPAEIEAALIALPGVKDCGVFGVPDDEFGETVVAMVQPESNKTLDEATVIAALRGTLAGYKLPRRVLFADALPRDDSGKLFKRRLRDAFMAGQPTR